MGGLTYYDSPLGCITLTGEGDALTGLRFEGRRPPAELLSAGHEEKPLPVLSEAARWLDLYFAGRDPGFTPTLRLKGSPFSRAVWELLLTVPFGETVTYGALAARLAEARGLPRMSAQAVGGAVGRNPVALIVPCHRVIGADGGLVGYGGGLRRKEILLELENAAQQKKRS